MSNNDDHLEVVYFELSPDGKLCHIGKTTNLRKRIPKTHPYGYKLYGFIIGNGNGSDLRIHDYFYDYKAKEHGGTELFYFRDELKEYVEWLGTRAYFGTTVEDVENVYPFPGRFPWTAHITSEGQQSLLGFDSIVPEVLCP